MKAPSNWKKLINYIFKKDIPEREKYREVDKRFNFLDRRTLASFLGISEKTFKKRIDGD